MEGAWSKHFFFAFFVELALEADLTCLRICLERLVPPKKGANRDKPPGGPHSSRYSKNPCGSNCKVGCGRNHPFGGQDRNRFSRGFSQVVWSGGFGTAYPRAGAKIKIACGIRRTINTSHRYK